MHFGSLLNQRLSLFPSRDILFATMLQHKIVTLKYRQSNSSRSHRLLEEASDGTLAHNAPLLVLSSRNGSDLGNSAKISKNSSQPRTIESSLQSLAALYNSRNSDQNDDLEWLNGCEHIGDRLKFLKALYKNVAILRRSKLRERARSLSNANSSSSVDLVRSGRIGGGSMAPTSEAEAATDSGVLNTELVNAHQYLTVADINTMAVPVTVHVGGLLDNNSESRDEMDFEEDEVEDMVSPGTKGSENDQSETNQRSVSPAIRIESELDGEYGGTYISSPVARELSVPLENEYGNMSESS